MRPTRGVCASGRMTQLFSDLMEILSAAATVFAGLLSAALGADISHRFDRARNHLEMKRDVLRRLMGYRWQLTPGCQHPEVSVYTGLNEIAVVFSGDQHVEHALAQFKAQIAQGFRARDFSLLAKAMAKSAKVQNKRWSCGLIESLFTPPSP